MKKSAEDFRSRRVFFCKARQKKWSLQEGGTREKNAIAAPRAIGRAAILCGVVFCIGLDGASAGTSEFDFDLPRQSLSHSLLDFSRISREQVIYTESLVSGLTALPLQGSYTPEQALDLILRCSGLTAERSPSGIIMINTRGKQMGSLNKFMKRVLMPALSTSAMAAVCNAMDAQPQPYPAAEASPSASRSSATGTASPSLEEVVVTAQRREEKLKDVPLSVVVHTAAELEQSGIQSLRELGQVTPSVQIPNNGAYAAPTIRGISSDVASPGAQNSVAIYVDGVYQPAQGTAAFDLPDVSNVQILKGPQGTLYGRNASAGAILISTADPTFTPSGRAFVSYGRYDDIESKAFISGPVVSDKVAASIAGYYHSNDGYVHDLLNGGDTGSLRSKLVRGKLLITPTERISIKLTGYYSDRDDGAVTAASVPDGNTIAIAVPGVIVGTQPYTTAQNPPSGVSITTKGASAEAKFDTDAGTVTSVTGWTKMNAQYLVNADYSSAGLVYYIVDNFEDAFTEDLTFSSRKFGDVTFLAGASYLHDDGKFDPLTILNITQLYDRTRTEAISGFAEVSYDVTDRLALVGGARYSREKKEQYVSFGVRAFPKVDEATWSATTPRASIKFKLTDSLNTYLTYSEGFKSGSYNSFSLTPVDQEKVKAFELGLKADFARVFTFNAAAFHYKFTNMQVQSVQAGQVTIQNAGSSKIYGVDLDGSYAATDRLSLRGGVSFLHARFDSFPSAAINVPNPVCPTGYPFCGNITVTRDISGTPLERAPDKTAFLSAAYDVPTSYGTFSAQATGSYNSGFLWTFGDVFKQGPYALLNAQITWAAPDTRLKLSLWGRNLTDRVYGVAHGIGNPSAGIAWASPRTYGVSADYGF